MKLPSGKRLWVGIAVAAAVVAVAVVLVMKTEWVDVEVPRAPSGAAALDDHFALLALIRRIGARVEEHEVLAALPPKGTILVLQNWSWTTFPEQDRALRSWVEGGGHLVAGLWAVMPARGKQAKPEAEFPMAWIGVRYAPFKPRAAASSDNARARAPAQAYPAYVQPPRKCVRVGLAPGEELCGYYLLGATLVAERPALWEMRDDDGARAVRVAAAAGDVTVLPNLELLGNRALLLGDNALIDLDALGVQRDSVVWLVTGNARESLLFWLWERATPAVVLLALALLAWLWRGLPRFGPSIAAAALARRSAAEQITGTALFLWRYSPRALLAAQLRALDEAGRRRIRGYAALESSGRAAAVARRAQCDGAALQGAADPADAPGRHTLAQRLAILEDARRRLLRAGARPDHR